MRDLILNEPPICARCEEEFIFDDDMTAPRYCDPCAHERVSELEVQMETLLQSISDAGIEVVDGKVVNPWISAEHKKPQLGEYILFEVPSCYGVEKGMFHADRREPWISDRTSPYNDTVSFTTDMVTKWMPLPAPPTGSAEEVKP